jgi:tRNA(adenine34) deaminase
MAGILRMAKKRLANIISIVAVLVFVISFQLTNPVFADEKADPVKYLDDIEKEIANFKPDPNYPDDVYIIITIREAIAAKREGNGPIGVCLVREKDGVVLETGHNRQNVPYFRSDLHAEMDMLTRYENRIQMQRIVDGKQVNPRIMYQGLILYSSLEPCLMCLTRILNAGIPKVYYAASDDPRGVANNLQCLPAYWKDILEKNMKYGIAKCSPRLKEIASSIFWKGRKESNKSSVGK